MLEYPLWKRLCVVVTILVGLAFAAPNLFSEQARQSIPSWLPSAGVNLGLDLRGGAHVLLESQVEEVFEKRISDLRQQVRRALLDADVRRFSRLSRGADFVSVTVTNAEDMETARAALAALSEPVGMGLASGLGFETGARTFDIAVDGQTITLTMTEEERAQIVDRTISQSLEVIRRRIDESGTRDPTIQRQGTDRVLVQVPGVGSAEEVLSLIGRTASLTFHDVVLDGDPDRPRPGTIAAPYPEFGQVLVLRENPVLSGERLVDAQLGFDPDSGAPVVNFRFDATGGGIFSDYTRSNIGRPFAIVLDGEVISAPNIQSAITGGAGFIEGGFTVETARDLAVLLRSGALPASLVPLEQRTVGPDLGADSIAAGEAAAVLAFLAVLIFMSIVYRAFGIFANIALMLNVGLILGALSAIGATLTLPGIAGIVLTIGMAVDANVLVFERIREELKRAKKPHQAVDRGYSEALSAIIDANITTLIAAVILFVLGSGPVKGFAVTLGLGIFTSVFTAVFVTRLMVVVWLERTRPKELRVERIKLLPDGLRVAAMRFRKMCASVSAGFGVLSIVLVMALGLNFGIDFRGGTLIEARTAQVADLSAIRETVTELDLGDVAVQSFGSDRDVLVRVEEQELTGGERMDVAETVGSALVEAFPGTDIRRVEVVGPKVSGELLQAGILAVTLAVAAVLFYIWIRFEWQFGVGAVVALVHDVVLTVGVFSLLGIEFNLAIIAALLTIVGYSLNDTVVVYDRVRENLRKYKKTELAEVLDISVSETLSRTLMTSVTTLVALIALFVLGPEVISGFTFAMIWGVVIGTYSSIFIAAAMLLTMNVKREWSDPTQLKAGMRADGAQV